MFTLLSCQSLFYFLPELCADEFSVCILLALLHLENWLDLSFNGGLVDNSIFNVISRKKNPNIKNVYIGHWLHKKN